MKLFVVTNDLSSDMQILLNQCTILSCLKDDTLTKLRKICFKLDKQPEDDYLIVSKASTPQKFIDALEDQ